MLIAQSVERLTFNQVVEGSNPPKHTLPLLGKYHMEEGIIIVKISKKEKDFLEANGLCFGWEGELHHTVARHRRTYYMSETQKAKELLTNYRKSITEYSEV